MVDVINAIAFAVFVIALVIGAGATLARFIRYHVQGWPRPKLLTRDVLVIGGLAIAAGALLTVRMMRAIGVDITSLSTNLLWVALTTIPPVGAFVVYAYFEVFVIERGRDEPYREREQPEPRAEDHVG